MGQIALSDKVTDITAFCKDAGRALALSGMFGLAREEQGFVVMMTCYLENMTPLEFFRRYHVIQNKPAMRTDYMLAEFNSRGGRHEILKKTPDEVSVLFEYPVGKKITVSVTWDEMQQEPWPWVDKSDHSKGLKDNWNSPRQRQNMMFKRLVSETIRDILPSINAGMYAPEELEDLPGGMVPAPIAQAPPSLVAAVLGRPVEQETAPVVVEATATVVETVPVESKSDFKKDAEILEGEIANPTLVSPEQVAKIKNLFQVCSITELQQRQALGKRSVTRIEDLNTLQAAEMIANLENRKAQIEAKLRT
jgi:hypothetical protein